MNETEFNAGTSRFALSGAWLVDVATVEERLVRCDATSRVGISIRQ